MFMRNIIYLYPNMRRLIILLLLAFTWLSAKPQAVLQQPKTPSSGSNAGSQYFQWWGGYFNGYLILPNATNPAINRPVGIDGQVAIRWSDTTLITWRGGQWIPLGGGGGADSAIYFSGIDFTGLGTFSTPIEVNRLHVLTDSLIANFTLKTYGHNLTFITDTSGGIFSLYSLTTGNSAIATVTGSTVNVVGADQNSAVLTSQLSGKQSGILASTNGITTSVDTRLHSGLKADSLSIWPQTWTNWNYVTKRYADSVVSASSVTASNGLSKVGSDIRLGGNMSSNVLINTNGNKLEFFDNVNNLDISMSGIIPSISLQAGSGGTSQVVLSPNTTFLSATSPLGRTSNIALGGGGVNVVADHSYMRYGANYDGYFGGDGQAIVDKRYVDSVAGLPSANIYNSNGSLTSDRQVDFNGHYIQFGGLGPGGYFATSLGGTTVRYDDGVNPKLPELLILDSHAFLGYSNINTLGQQGFYNDGSNNYIRDDDNGVGVLADAAIDTAKMTTHVNAYATVKWIKGYVSGHAGATPNLQSVATVGNSYTGEIQARDFAATGTGSNGYIDVLSQSASPSAVTNHLRLYSDSLNRLSWKNSTYRRTLRVARPSDMTISAPWRLNPILADSTDVATTYVPLTRTVAGIPLSSNVSLAALTATNSSLTFSGSYDGSTARNVGINLANGNFFTAAQGVSITGVGTGATLGFTVSNPDAATSGNQKYSPLLGSEGFGWNTTAGGSSQKVGMYWQVQPVQGTNVTGSYVLMQSVNGATPTSTGITLGLTGALSTVQAQITSATGNMSSPSTTGLTNGTNAGLLFNGVASSPGIYYRNAFGNGSVSTTATANTSIADNIFTGNATTAATGTHGLLTTAVFKPITWTSGGATVTEASTIRVEGAPTGTATNKYAIRSIGNNRLSGLVVDSAMTVTNSNLTLGTAGNKLVITEGTNGSVGQTTLVAGTKAITISGLTTSSRAIVTFVSAGGTVTTTWQYAAVCTSNTLTITALTNAGTTDTSDTSTLNYFIVN